MCFYSDRYPHELLRELMGTPSMAMLWVRYTLRIPLYILSVTIEGNLFLLSNPNEFRSIEDDHSDELQWMNEDSNLSAWGLQSFCLLNDSCVGTTKLWPPKLRVPHKCVPISMGNENGVLCPLRRDHVPGAALCWICSFGRRAAVFTPGALSGSLPIW